MVWPSIMGIKRNMHGESSSGFDLGRRNKNERETVVKYIKLDKAGGLKDTDHKTKWMMA